MILIKGAKYGKIHEGDGLVVPHRSDYQQPVRHFHGADYHLSGIYEIHVLQGHPGGRKSSTISILMLYAGFLGATVAYRQRMHSRHQDYSDETALQGERLFYFAIDIMVGSFAIAMIGWGGNLAWDSAIRYFPPPGYRS
jgi:hypothetical protein